MRFRLRTLLIVLGLVPPLLAWVWVRRPPTEELLGCATLLAICSMAWWSLGLSAKEHAALMMRAERHAGIVDGSQNDEAD